MSERGRREDVRIAHTVAYLLRCHGATGGNVDDNDDNGEGVTGDKVDNDCNGTTDDDINDDDEGATGDDDNDDGDGTMGDDDNSNGATGDKVDDDGGGATGNDNDVTMVTARWDTMTTTMVIDVIDDDNECDNAISMMCDEGDNRNSDDGEDACASAETTPAHRQRRRHSQA
jgi:hypothetical protein